MKTFPNRVYMAESNSHPGRPAQEYFLPYPWTKFNNVEYIRKDALLKWAEEAKYRTGMLTSEYGRGYTKALETIIDKLNEL